MRRVMICAAAALLVTAASCSTDQRRTASPADSSRVHPRTDRFVDLPRSPVGDWPIYNWVWLADGSGFVQAGAGRVSGSDGRVVSTPRSAEFRFDTGRYESLPDLPVTAGVGHAEGTRLKDRLILTGQDCPPSPGASAVGIEFCRSGGSGAKVVFTVRDGDRTWTRLTLPDWMAEFRDGTPKVLGSLDHEVVLASGHEPAHLAALDPSTGSWRRLPDAPDSNVTLCLTRGELWAWRLQAPGSGPDPSWDWRNDWWHLVGDAWAKVSSPVDGQVAQAVCTLDGFALEADSGRVGGDGPRELWWVEPSGTATAPVTAAATLDTFEDRSVMARIMSFAPLPSTSGSRAPATTTTTDADSGGGTVAVPRRTLVFFGPSGIIDTGVVDPAASYAGTMPIEAINSAVGSYVVLTNDEMRQGRTRSAVPQILRDRKSVV